VIEGRYISDAFDCALNIKSEVTNDPKQLARYSKRFPREINETRVITVTGVSRVAYPTTRPLDCGAIEFRLVKIGAQYLLEQGDFPSAVRLEWRDELYFKIQVDPNLLKFKPLPYPWFEFLNSGEVGAAFVREDTMTNYKNFSCPEELITEGVYNSEFYIDGL
jgi:hypothetical protein